MRELLLSVQRSRYREGAPLDDASDLRAFIRGVRNNAYGCDGFLLGVADLCGVPIVVDSIASETGVRRMAQITWPTEVAAPRYVLHLFLQHDKHCVAIARVAAAADGLGHRCLRPKPGGPPASSADAPPAAADPDAATGGDGDGDEATDEEGPVCEIVDDGAPGVPRIPEVLCPYPPGHRMAAARETVARRWRWAERRGPRKGQGCCR